MNQLKNLNLKWIWQVRGQLKIVAGQRTKEKVVLDAPEEHWWRDPDTDGGIGLDLSYI